MRKFELILLLICILCIIPSVNASINDTESIHEVDCASYDTSTYDKSNSDNTAKSNSDVIENHSLDDNNQKTISKNQQDKTSNIKTSTSKPKHSSKLSVANITVTYSDKTVLRATVIDKTLNKYIANGKLAFKINGITIGTVNIINGKASIAYDTTSLKNGKYTINAVYAGSSTVNSNRANATLTIKKIATRIVLSNVNAKTNTKTTIKAQVYDSKNKLVKSGKLAFKINGLTIAKVSVKNGIATTSYTPLNIVRNYTISAVYGGTSIYQSSKKSSKLLVSLKIYTINWSSKGNIQKNTVLYNRLPKTSITQELVNCASTATPYVVLGDGKGKCVFIVAGIHGNELSSQLAAVRLINNLATKKIHGTLYIFPFVAPSYTGNNTRTINGVNLNSVADRSGTLSNKLVNFAKNKNAVSLGDFHCTMPGGKPGCNSVLGTYSPLGESATLSKYISSKTSSKSVIYSRAASEYPGAVEDYCNIRGIVSVTCEVKTPHGTIASGSSEKSYSMMQHYLNYYKLT